MRYVGNAGAQRKSSLLPQTQGSRFRRNLPPPTHGSPQKICLHQHLKLTRSEEHTSELQSLMRISYAVFCLTKQKTDTNVPYNDNYKTNNSNNNMSFNNEANATHK